MGCPSAGRGTTRAQRLIEHPSIGHAGKRTVAASCASSRLGPLAAAQLAASNQVSHNKPTHNTPVAHDHSAVRRRCEHFIAGQRNITVNGKLPTRE